MNKYKRIEELNKRLAKMRLSTQNAEVLDMLRTELQSSDDQETNLYIYSLIVTELQAQERLDEAETAIRARIEIQPHIADGWISLALHHFYYTRNLEEALLAIDTALIVLPSMATSFAMPTLSAFG